MHQYRSKNLFNLLFPLFFFAIGISNDSFCQKKKVVKKPTEKNQKAKKEPKAPEPQTEKTPSLPKTFKLVYVDAFVGPSMNFASGDYIDYQKTAYLTTNPDFYVAGEIKNIRSFTAGGQVRVYPFKDQVNALKPLSFCLGASYLHKGFSHTYGLQNRDTSLNYLDETRITERWNAYFLSTFLTARYGRKLYAEAGISLDWFLSGVRNKELTRATSGENAFGGAFTTTLASNDNLTSKLMAKQSVGFVFGVGYQIIDWVGVRISNNFNSHFFKEGPDLTNYQPSFQVTFSLP